MFPGPILSTSPTLGFSSGVPVRALLSVAGGGVLELSTEARSESGGVGTLSAPAYGTVAAAADNVPFGEQRACVSSPAWAGSQNRVTSRLLSQPNSSFRIINSSAQKTSPDRLLTIFLRTALWGRDGAGRPGSTGMARATSISRGRGRPLPAFRELQSGWFESHPVAVGCWDERGEEGYLL